jgi:protein phosphatase
MRAELLKIAAQHGSPTVAIIFALPQAINEQWNANRERRVPADALERHRKNLDLSLRVLPGEKFNTLYTLSTPEEVANSPVILGGLIPERSAPPFDIIGDVHGCCDELTALLERLGYQWREDEQIFEHPEGRVPVFVGDLVDRGPASIRILALVERMAARGTALLVQGNHDNKFLRWLLGRKVHVKHGLAATIAELDTLPPEQREALKPRLISLLQNAPGYLILDEGRLVVTHAGIRDAMIGQWSRAIQAFCLYGDVAGTDPQSGLPVRLDWAASRPEEQATAGPLIVYGHNVVEEPRNLNRTLNIDTGCVFGGSLTALRYPEMDLVQVPAARDYYHPEKAETEEPPEEAAS